VPTSHNPYHLSSNLSTTKKKKSTTKKKGEEEENKKAVLWQYSLSLNIG
jgi:hypothetical protein